MDRKVVFPRSLEYLIAVAQHGSFTRAAESMHVTQPSLSQQIKQLEDQLHTTLLDRCGRTVRLTDAGEIYLQHARRAWGEMDAGTRAIRDVQDLSRGSLRLGWTPITDHLTFSLLGDFTRRYPGISLSTLEMPQNDIETALSEDRIDVGIVFSKAFSVDERHGDIETRTLFEDDFCMTVGRGHPLAGQTSTVSSREFGQESLVLLNKDFALRTHIDNYCMDEGIAPHVAIETNSVSVIIEMVLSGRLATVLPSSIVSAQSGLCGIEMVPAMPRKAITLISRKSGYKSPACQAFSQLAAAWSSQRPLMGTAKPMSQPVLRFPQRKKIKSLP